MSSIAFDYKQLANSIIANSESLELVDPTTYNPELHVEENRAVIAAANGTTVLVGPYKVRPGLHQEVPIGRSFQPILERAVSRLAAFVGRDEYGLTIRDVPEDANLGLRPSSAGVWVKQPGDTEFRRLRAGETARLTRYSDVRIGGNGVNGATGFPLQVVQ